MTSITASEARALARSNKEIRQIFFNINKYAEMGEFYIDEKIRNLINQDRLKELGYTVFDIHGGYRISWEKQVEEKKYSDKCEVILEAIENAHKKGKKYFNLYVEAYNTIKAENAEIILLNKGFRINTELKDNQAVVHF